MKRISASPLSNPGCDGVLVIYDLPKVKGTLKPLPRAALDVVIAQVVAIEIMFFDGYHQLRANTNEVSESQETVLAIEGVFRSILNTETAPRGFVISGDEAFLMPYHLGYKAFAAAIQRALDLRRARPEQLAHLEKVRVLETHWRTHYVEPLIYADPDRLMQVLTNLLTDAAKFSPRHEIVTLSCRAGGTNVRIEVRDRGPGIPRDFRNRISSAPPDRRARAEQRW